MPYITERGVKHYHDRSTPAEFATSEDEDRARFNEARDRAFDAAEALCQPLDDLYSDPIAAKAGEMSEIADALEALLSRVRALAR